jgi:hypothetical protein
VAHHGAQNHNTVGRPASVAASYGLPSSVVPVNRSVSATAPRAAAGSTAGAFPGAAAGAGAPQPATATAAATASSARALNARPRRW